MEGPRVQLLSSHSSLQRFVEVCEFLRAPFRNPRGMVNMATNAVQNYEPMGG